MRLSFEDIKKITRGATYIEEINGEFVFHRFTKEQESLYDQNAPEFSGRARATTGVVLDFITDSQNLSARIYNKGSGVSRYHIDFYENDLMIHSPNVSGDTEPHRLSLSKGTKRIRIYLDSHSSTRVSDLELDDGATIIVPEYRARAILFGDSITQGARGDHTSLSYANSITAHFGWDAINYGVGGDIFRGWTPGTEKVFDPDIITVAYGTNDWHSKPRDVIEANAKAFFERICELYPEARKFYISPLWRSGYADKVSAGDFFETVGAFERIASDAGATVIRGLELVPHINDFFDDGLHPNDLGYTYYARSLIKALEKEGVR